MYDKERAEAIMQKMYEEGRSYKEIGEELGISAEAARGRIRSRDYYAPNMKGNIKVKENILDKLEEIKSQIEDLTMDCPVPDYDFNDTDYDHDDSDEEELDYIEIDSAVNEFLDNLFNSSKNEETHTDNEESLIDILSEGLKNLMTEQDDDKSYGYYVDDDFGYGYDDEEDDDCELCSDDYYGEDKEEDSLLDTLSEKLATMLSDSDNEEENIDEPQGAWADDEIYEGNKYKIAEAKRLFRDIKNTKDEEEVDNLAVELSTILSCTINNLSDTIDEIKDKWNDYTETKIHLDDGFFEDLSDFDTFVKFANQKLDFLKMDAEVHLNKANDCLGDED